MPKEPTSSLNKLRDVWKRNIMSVTSSQLRVYVQAARLVVADQPRRREWIQRVQSLMRIRDHLLLLIMRGQRREPEKLIPSNFLRRMRLDGPWIDLLFLISKSFQHHNDLILVIWEHLTTG